MYEFNDTEISRYERHGVARVRTSELRSNGETSGLISLLKLQETDKIRCIWVTSCYNNSPARIIIASDKYLVKQSLPKNYIQLDTDNSVSCLEYKLDKRYGYTLLPNTEIPVSKNDNSITPQRRRFI